MQTFLPYSDYYQSAYVLEPTKHLGNQAYRECLTLFRGGWPNHPAARMWHGHRYHLGLYALACLEVLQDIYNRPYPHWASYYRRTLRQLTDTGPPTWLGQRSFHQAHRSNLLRKNPEWYRQFWPKLRDDLPYVWPV